MEGAKVQGAGRRLTRARLEARYVWSKGEDGLPRIDPMGGQFMRVDRPRDPIAISMRRFQLFLQAAKAAEVAGS